MVNYFSDSLHWGHGKPSFAHEHSGVNSCWNWDVQKVLSRKCTKEVNEFLSSGRANTTEDAMILCFVSNASESHRVCTRELEQYKTGSRTLLDLHRCAQKEFGLAISNLVQTSVAVGECRPIP